LDSNEIKENIRCAFYILKHKGFTTYLSYFRYHKYHWQLWL